MKFNERFRFGEKNERGYELQWREKKFSTVGNT